MLAVVLPARNEAATIAQVLRQVLRLPAELIVPVLNGCDDMSAEIVKRLGNKRIQPLHFREPLGYDVPRIAGARAALEAGARTVLFVDGDLSGAILGTLLSLAAKVRSSGADLALTDCYAGTPRPSRSSSAARVYQSRMELNAALGRGDLGPAIPSHGPSAVSRRLLETVPLWSAGIPPVMQSFACEEGLKVAVGAALPHARLGSAARDSGHRGRIAQTIIGDCVQARCRAESRPPERAGQIGYHAGRRFDLLGIRLPDEYAAGVSSVAGED